MKCERKPRFVDAIRWDGINLVKVKEFVPKITYAAIKEPDNHLFLMNEYNHMYSAKIGDYIVYDGTKTYTAEKKSFEQEYRIYEN